MQRMAAAAKARREAASSEALARRLPTAQVRPRAHRSTTSSALVSALEQSVTRSCGATPWMSTAATDHVDGDAALDVNLDRE